MRNWYLVYCKPRGDEIAKLNLERQGYETYLPLIRQRRRRAGKSAIRVESMFPRYLFIHLDTETDNWAPIRSTLGVTSLVRFGPDPTVVPEELVQLLRESEDGQGIHELPIGDFKKGDAVRIAEGPMMGYEGVFLAKTARDRVVVLLDIVGRQARAKVDISQLESAH